MTDQPLDLSIIIVNYNTQALLQACLNSIYQHTQGISFEVLVLDNASHDGSAALVADTFPQVTLIASDENLGFTRGNNELLPYTQGRYVLLLNPDTELIDNALQKFCAYLDSHPDVGIIAPTLLLSDGSIQGGTAGYYPTLTSVLAHTLMLHTMFPRHIPSIWLAAKAFKGADFAVDWVGGSCLMIRQSVITQIGVLNPTIAMYAEDLEWCYRAKKAGWRVMCLSSIRVIHHGGGSMSQMGVTFSRKHIDGLNAFYRLYYHTTMIRLLNSLGFIGALLRTIGYRLLAVLHRANASYKAQYYTVLARTYGEYVLYPHGSD